MSDEQYERWLRELEKESMKEWKYNSTAPHAGNMYGIPKKEGKQL